MIKSRARQSRPNILLLMTDQQRFDTIAAGGHPHMKTPHLDRLLGEGCHFTNAYTPNPICQPARYHTLTGTTARHHGFYLNAGKPLSSGIPTLPGLLSDAGYDTRAIGKMHFVPVRRHHGFDRMELMEERPVYRENDEYVMHLHASGYGHVQNIHGVRNVLYESPQRSLLPDELHGSVWVADRTIAYLEANRGRQPFFCWSSWIAPHPPFNLTQWASSLYQGQPLPKPAPSITPINPFTRIMSDDHTYPPRDPVRREAFMRRRQEAYYAQITHVDQQVGRVYETLEKKGLLDNTLIIFTSDHGEMLGDHGSYQKAQPYDGASRIPFIVRYPAGFTPGTTCTDFVDLNDILPTALHAAGICHPRPELLPGGSLLSEDFNTTLPLRRDRSTQYFSLGQEGRRWATVRDERYKYTWYYGYNYAELYDLASDPDESINLLCNQPGVVPSPTPELQSICSRLHASVVAHEMRWGPEDHVTSNGQLRSFTPPDHGSDEALFQSQLRQFPAFPANIMNDSQKAAITPFVVEAMQAVAQEPVSSLDRFDLSAWQDQPTQKRSTAGQSTSRL